MMSARIVGEENLSSISLNTLPSIRQTSLFSIASASSASTATPPEIPVPQAVVFPAPQAVVLPPMSQRLTGRRRFVTIVCWVSELLLFSFVATCAILALLHLEHDDSCWWKLMFRAACDWEAILAVNWAGTLILHKGIEIVWLMSVDDACREKWRSMFIFVQAWLILSWVVMTIVAFFVQLIWLPDIATQSSP